MGAIFLGLEPGSGVAGITQTLSSVLTSGTKYDLQVKVGNAAPDEYTAPGFPGYAVQLWAGVNLLAQDYNTLNPDEGTFATSTVSYIASADNPYLGQSLEIRLLNLLQGPGAETGFDDVRLEATSVPEPTSIFGLLGLAAFGAVSAIKKKLTSSERA